MFIARVRPTYFSICTLANRHKHYRLRLTAHASRHVMTASQLLVHADGGMAVGTLVDSVLEEVGAEWNQTTPENAPVYKHASHAYYI